MNGLVIPLIPPYRSFPLRLILGCVLTLCLLAACRTGSPGLSHPVGVDVAADGSLYVMDHADLWHSRVVHIRADGKTIKTFKPQKTNPDLVYAGWDMAVGPGGNVYYCNLVSNDERTLHDGLMEFSGDGKFIAEIGAADYGSEPSQTAAVPYNLDVDSRGWIYVTDFNYNRLRVFDPQGKLLAELSADNVEGFYYDGIGDVVVDDARGLLYLIDFYQGRLDQYRLNIQPDGSIHLAFQLSVGKYGHGPGEFSFAQNLAVDETTGYVYVGDMGNRRIQAFDAEGNFVTEFSPPVDEWQVLGLAIGKDAQHPGSQAVYAADALNTVIWVFTPQGQFLRKIEVH